MVVTRAFARSDALTASPLFVVPEVGPLRDWTRGPIDRRGQLLALRPPRQEQLMGALKPAVRFVVARAPLDQRAHVGRIPVGVSEVGVS